MTATYVIPVVDARRRRWPSAWELAHAGVPWRVAENYDTARWYFTKGLRLQLQGVRRN